MTADCPYTHWAYFTDRTAADRCASELTAAGLLCGVDYRDNITVTADAAECIAQGDDPERYVWPTGPEWRLLAAHDVDLDTDYHTPIRAVVNRHGGDYDGGESGLLGATGQPVRAAEGRP